MSNEISQDEVAANNHADSLWVVIDSKGTAPPLLWPAEQA